MKTKKKLLSVLLLAMCLSLLTFVPVSAESVTNTNSNTTTTSKEGWVKKNGKYYWQKANGKIRKKAGLIQVGKNYYYLKKGGARLEASFKKIDGKYYYFKSTGKMIKPSKGRFYNLQGNRYYFYKDGHVATGRKKVQGKYYYFDSKGRMQKNVSAVKVGKKYYSVNSKGVMSWIPAKKAECQIAAQNFISKHSNSSQSNAQKFRSCFNYLLGYMKYTPGFFRASSDYAIIDRKYGAYELALSTFNSPNLRGNCHRFACCIAAIAKELGYQPTVIVTTGDHSFVMINGGYYDNMYGGLFGASSRPAYSVYKRTVF